MPQLIQAPSWQKALEAASQASLGVQAGQKQAFDFARDKVKAGQEDAIFQRKLQETDLSIENEKLRQRLQELEGNLRARTGEQNLQQGRVNLASSFVGLQGTVADQAYTQGNRAKAEASKPLLGDATVQSALQGLRPDVQYALIPEAERLEKLRARTDLDQDKVTEWFMQKVEGAKRQAIFNDAGELENEVANDIAGQAFADLPEIQGQAEAIAHSLKQLPPDAAQAAQLLDQQRAAYGKLKSTLTVAQEDQEARFRLATKLSRMANESPDLPEGMRRMYGLFSSAVQRRSVKYDDVLDAIVKLEYGDLSAAARLQQTIMQQQSLGQRQEIGEIQRNLRALMAAGQTQPPGLMTAPTGGASAPAQAPTEATSPLQEETLQLLWNSIKSDIDKDVDPETVMQTYGLTQGELQQVVQYGQK